MKIYLYVKKHKTTGLKYFGKTTKKDPYSYLGSGKYWIRHLKKHGPDVETINVWSFEDSQKCEKFALNFSSDNKIVESKEWANLRPENGRDGQVTGAPGMKGERNPRFGMVGELNAFYGKKHKEKTIALYKEQKKRSGNPRAKAVVTPHGNFQCVKDAADAEGVHHDTITRRIKNSIPGYRWL